MSLKSSNLYAERVFAEHPLALWAFDEENSYLSLLTTAQKDLKDERYWSIQGADIEEIFNPIDNNPFPESPQTRLLGDESIVIETTNNIQIHRPNDVDLLKDSITISFYSFQLFNDAVKSYTIEMFFNNIADEEVIAGSQTFDAPSEVGWGQVISTFSINFNDLRAVDPTFISANLRFRIIIEFGDAFPLTRLIQISGMNIGQWSESFMSTSGGVQKLPLPSNVSHLINQVSTKLNLIPDLQSSFEEEFDKWIAAGTIISRTQEESNDRLFSAKVAYLGSSSNPGIQYGDIGDMLSVSCPRNHTIGAWVKSGPGQSHNLRIRVKEYTAQDDETPIAENVSSSFTVGDEEWFQLEYTFQTNAAGNYVIFNIESDDALSPGDFFYVDQVLFVQCGFLRNYYKYTYSPLDSYGLNDADNGYYLIEDNRLLSRTSGLPMVFGSNHTTKIFPPLEEINPSILMPGKGFLNQSGQYNVITFEAWMRLENVSPDPVKIVGPAKTVNENGEIVNSLDGLYVEEGFLTLRVGEYSKSYFVGRWLRPMLVHIVYKPEEIVLLVNGSRVIEMPIDIERISLAPQEFLVNGEFKNFDYIGIFGNSLVSPFEIDTISIYPYEVNPDYAKRRFIYGQGVTEQASANEKYASVITAIDFSDSNYAANMIYPDINGWNSGFSNNLNNSGTMLKVPDLPLPQTLFANNLESIDDWLFNNYLIQEEDDTFTRPTSFFKMRPTPEYADKRPTIYFSNLAEITNNLNSIVATFKSPEFPVANQVLFRLNNRVTKDIFSAILDGNELKYFYTKSGESSQQLGPTTIIDDNTVFVAGINTKVLTTNYYSTIGSFFSSPELLGLNFGGYNNDIFEGRIYTLSIDSPFSFSRGLNEFFEDGFILQEYDLDFSVAILLTSWAGNYTLIPLELNSTMTLDIAISGYWEDSQPLSYFGKSIVDSRGRRKYDLDMIQFNVDLPKPSIRKVTLFGQYNYGRLKEDWGSPFQRSYADLSDVLQGGYLTYADLAAAQAEYEFEGLGVAVNTFVTIQTFDQVGRKPYSDFTNTLVPQFNNLVDLDSTTLDLNTTKFQVVDGSIIIPPLKKNFQNYYLTTHIDVNVRGIKSKPFGLKRMELASFVFNDTSPQSIGTRFGEPIFPFTRFGENFTYKVKNPFRINKETSPYLYLTDSSGIQPVGFPSRFDRGIAVPINKNLIPEYTVGAFQLWTKYNLNVFSNVPTKMFSIKGPSSIIDFYVFADGGQRRGILQAIDRRTGNFIDNVAYYQDGKYTVNPIIYPREWTSLNVTFEKGLDMSAFVGTVELFEGFSYDNIIVYKNSDAIERQSNVFERWGSIASGTWEDVYGTEPPFNTWAATTVRSVPITFVIDSVTTYNSQIGLSIAVIEDESSLEFNSAGVDLFMENQWDEFFLRPI